MRLRAMTFVLIALAGVGFGAERVAERATGYVERATLDRVTEGLQAAGEDWVRASVDGLIVTLRGAAPDEARRLRAAEIARRMVDPRRVRDATRLARPAPLAPPPFAVDLLRGGDEVSLIGLAPVAAGGEAIAAALDDAGLSGALTDMLEIVDQPTPPGWEAALGYGLAALDDLPQARISVTPGRVEIAALADDEDDRAALEARLRATLPAGVALALEIAAPRPVIAPFRVDFSVVDGAARLDACSAETVEAAAAITAAAGLPAAACALGLGAPSPDWATVAAAGIAAVRDLRGGRFEATGAEARLTAPGTAAPERLAAVADALQGRLPPVYALTVAGGAAPAPPNQPDGAPVAARFDAVLAKDGSVRLTGAAQDETSRAAIGGFAAALFGHERVENAVVVAPLLPDGWPGRVLAGVEALSLMKEGRLEVTPEVVAVEGWAETADGAAKAQALLAEETFGPTRVAVRFDAAAAAAAAEARAAAEDPVGACAAALAAAQATQTIAFEPGSARLEDAGAAAVEVIARVLAGCPPLDVEIAGHTDSAGRSEANQALSEERAEAVRAALAADDLTHLRLVARGHGATRPIADNETEAGRAQNRRIAFSVLTDAPAAEVRIGPR